MLFFFSLFFLSLVRNGCFINIQLIFCGGHRHHFAYSSFAINQIESVLLPFCYNHGWLRQTSPQPIIKRWCFYIYLHIYTFPLIGQCPTRANLLKVTISHSGRQIGSNGQLSRKKRGFIEVWRRLFCFFDRRISQKKIRMAPNSTN